MEKQHAFFPDFGIYELQKSNYTPSQKYKGNTELRKIVNSFLAWHCKLSSTNSRKVNISLTPTSINAFNSARHVLNSPTSQTFMNGLQKRKQIGLQPVT